VVHKNHGIGRYINLVSEMNDGNKKEFFLIEYANNDRLFVPVWQSDRIHKYTGDKVPAVTALNSRQWENLQTRVRSSIQKLAVDLASLYAVRDAAKGFAFTADDIWQKEMEDLFPFTETKDQARAIKTVKELMALERPMDLLVCGDVGFGKTEVAIRSAFKAIENGKQVLMLVPTTILADQHSKTFKERYGNFPVVVEVISRFKTPGQQKEIIKRFEEKKVDMLIGTHRILSEDIKPADLGLIIVDEEQRFGVNAKEKLKMLKKNVDALTLTATPIPRTLYMSLSGIRDMVLIQTYPSGRFPIETFAGSQSEIVIKMAIEREIKRGGQVYFVHNRISDIYEKLYKLQSMLPGIKIAVTHGRMEGAEIEDIMQKFVDREYDVLLSTSIIESGMDISNVNTLIVENAHRFGLAQLYQLRGRVGRSSEKAYAYFFYPDRSQLNQAAFQRLKTLTEYTDLGSGYKVAMKDLEIRGAGELLGARQHGHINSIGFELYCQIIKEEVDRLKGVEVQPDLNVHIDLPVSAYIPKNYITKEKDRIDIYKSLGSATELEEINGIEKNIQSRHGLLPEVAKNLFSISVIKLAAKKSGIEQVFYIERKGLVFKKIILSEKNAKDLIIKNPDFIYLSKSREVIVKKTFKDLNLHLVINYLNDIIALYLILA
jgi:transcription-repair coupling factor (superfamily II helicase)